MVEYYCQIYDVLHDLYKFYEVHHIAKTAIVRTNSAASCCIIEQKRSDEEYEANGDKRICDVPFAA